ncbi:hypothetical protein PSY31_23355, partial [Shigella flexneri]|nr:hypothetical protein [Shigella flexneri]
QINPMATKFFEPQFGELEQERRKGYRGLWERMRVEENGAFSTQNQIFLEESHSIVTFLSSYATTCILQWQTFHTLRQLIFVESKF